MTKNPRKPTAVNKLIADAQERIARKKPARPPVNAVHHTSASLWAKIRLRKNGGR